MKNRDVPRIGFDEPFELQIATQLFWIKVILGTLALVLFGGLLGIALQARYSSRYSLSSTGSRGSSCLPWRNHNEKVQLVHELEIDSSSGDFLVGKIRYSPHERIGSGGNGTVVFRGLFEDRPVAVKRILPVYYSLVYREVQLLRETDEHPNVVRYFCMEEDPHFYYLALELCLATLAVYVEDSTFDKGNPPLQPLQAIHQASAGLEHLHNLNIAHRDVKPQNLLLSACGQTTELKVMISDFGLCKKLPHGDRSFSKKSGVLGTEGWIAPEVLVGGSGSRITKAIDIFSLGCVMYYVLSKGEHPFGDTFERQANIRKGKMSLLALTDNQHLTVKALIQQMLCSNPAKRPSVAQVTRHPSFWDATRTLSFFQEVSDRIEKEPYQSPVIRALEKDGRRILNSNNWMNQISCAVHADLRRFRSYKGGSVRDLLRAMRNKKNHYWESSPEVRAELGAIPNGFVAYFTGRFPRLLLHTYATMQSFRDNAPLLSDFYAVDVSSRFGGVLQSVELESYSDIDADSPASGWKIWKTNRLVKHSILNSAMALTLTDNAQSKEDVFDDTTWTECSDDQNGETKEKNVAMP